MTQDEFIRKTLNLPWVNRASSFESNDCWGLIVLYYKHVLNIELPKIEGYEQGSCDTSQGWESGESKWKELINAEVGALFTCYAGEKPIHVGILISTTKVLHANGFYNKPGKVEIHSIRAIKSIYGKMTYHKFMG